MDVSEVRADLLAEQHALDAIVADLDASGWSTDTPSERWDVADQIGHLAYFDDTATLAITDPERFQAHVSEVLRGDPNDPDASLAEFRALDHVAQLDRWRTNRQVLADASASLTNADRIIWYGPSMGSKSFLTARLMECWAHGQDIVDGLRAVGSDVERTSTDRLRHIAQLGFITRGWSYINRGLDVPDTPVRVELTAPSGDIWRYGPDDATESVVGTAEDFCLVATQRRHIDATDLVVTGDMATEWMHQAQAFAGAPTDGPDAPG